MIEVIFRLEKQERKNTWGNGEENYEFKYYSNYNCGNHNCIVHVEQTSDECCSNGKFSSNGNFHS